MLSHLGHANIRRWEGIWEEDEKAGRDLRGGRGDGIVASV
jgi:hypothetical protein